MDLRPLEKFSSVLMTGTIAVMSLALPAFVLLGALLALRESIVISGGLCCMAATMPIIGLMVQVVMRWTRRGSSVAYLQSVADELGVEADITAGTLLLPLMSPRMECRVEGRDLVVSLRRTAGFLTSPTPGGFGLRRWTQTLQVSGSIPSKLGYAHADSSAFGASLLGVSKPQKEDGVLVFTGKLPEVATAPTVLDAARAANIPPMSMAVIGREGLSMTAFMQSPDPATLSSRLQHLVSLVSVLESEIG